MIDLRAIRACAERVAPHVVRTPTVPLYGAALIERLGPETDVVLKMELFQRTGSFKARGALNVLLQLTAEERRSGVAAFSAGNHAIAAAYAARMAEVNLKIAMPATANPFRVEQVKALGAEIVFADGMNELMATVSELEAEGRVMVHPFEGERTFEGTGGVGLELCEDAAELDAVIVPVGGGGLISGVASAVRQLQPDAKVYGVEPDGADGMAQSLAAGEPLPRVAVNSIADSLSAPLHMPKSFAIVRDCVKRMVSVSDDAMREMMKLAFTDLKLAIEPACASGLAALAGPLRDELAGKRVGIVMCGSNIGIESWNAVVAD